MNNSQPLFLESLVLQPGKAGAGNFTHGSAFFFCHLICPGDKTREMCQNLVFGTLISFLKNIFCWFKGEGGCSGAYGEGNTATGFGPGLGKMCLQLKHWRGLDYAS